MLTITTAAFIKGAVTAAQFPHTRAPEFAFFGRSNAGKSSLINMLLNRKNLVKTGARPGMTREINFFMVNAPRNAPYRARTPLSAAAARCKESANRIETAGTVIPPVGVPVSRQNGQNIQSGTAGADMQSGHNGSADKHMQSSRADGSFPKNTGRNFTIADLPGYGFAQVSLSKRNSIDTMLYEYCTRRTELKTLFFLMDIRREPTEVEQRTLAFFCERRIHTVLVATKADKISKNSRIQRITALSTFFGCEKEAIIVTSSTKKDGRGKLLQHIAAYLRG